MAAERPGPKGVAEEEAANKASDERSSFISSDSKQPKGETVGVKADTFTGEAEKLLATSKQEPSTATDINEVLGKYLSELTNLGPEYGAEMEFLKPYLMPNNGAIAPAPTYSGPDAGAVGATQKALVGAEQNVANAAANMSPPGFGQAAQLAQQYVEGLPYQQPIQAALGYQKYLETYGGLSPNSTGVPEDIQNIYKAIGSGSNSSSGLPTPGQASAAANANQLLNTAQNTGSTSGGGNG